MKSSTLEPKIYNDQLLSFLKRIEAPMFINKMKAGQKSAFSLLQKYPTDMLSSHTHGIIIRLRAYLLNAQDCHNTAKQVISEAVISSSITNKQNALKHVCQYILSNQQQLNLISKLSISITDSNSEVNSNYTALKKFSKYITGSDFKSDLEYYNNLAQRALNTGHLTQQQFSLLQKFQASGTTALPRMKQLIRDFIQIHHMCIIGQYFDQVNISELQRVNNLLNKQFTLVDYKAKPIDKFLDQVIQEMNDFCKDFVDGKLELDKIYNIFPSANNRGSQNTHGVKRKRPS